MSNRESVVKARKGNKCFTLQQIGDMCGGISRERVRQILESEGLDTKSVRYATYVCNYCKKEFVQSIKFAKPFCSVECKSKHSNVDVACDNCGKLFKKKIYSIMRDIKYYGQQHSFCCRSCFDEWKIKSGFYDNKFTAMGKSGKFASLSWIIEKYGDVRDIDLVEILFREDIRHLFINCENCGKITEKSFSEITSSIQNGSHGKLFFCSRECCYEWRKNNDYQWRK